MTHIYIIIGTRIEYQIAYEFTETKLLAVDKNKRLGLNCRNCQRWRVCLAVIPQKSDFCFRENSYDLNAYLNA